LPPITTYFREGIDEQMSIDQTQHSLFGASKAAADILVQEYGRYFGMKTGIFRGGCLTGPQHAGAELHGFLAYLMKCAVTGRPYKIYGYKGKQVRDNIHCRDLTNAFYHFFRAPRPGEVYNIGGAGSATAPCTRPSHVSGNHWARSKPEYLETKRIGDHIGGSVTFPV
jgi:CDP-paratose 2-epimerase